MRMTPQQRARELIQRHGSAARAEQHLGLGRNTAVKVARGERKPWIATIERLGLDPLTIDENGTYLRSAAGRADDAKHNAAVKSAEATAREQSVLRSLQRWRCGLSAAEIAEEVISTEIEMHHLTAAVATLRTLAVQGRVRRRGHYWELVA